jgi:hypothetical protein
MKLPIPPLMPRKSDPRYAHFKDMDKFDQIQITASYIIRIVMLGFVVWYTLHERFFMAFLMLAFIALTLIPAIIQKNYRVITPIELDTFVTVLIFVSLLLGDVLGLYYKIPHYDDLMHFTASFILGIVGFLIVYLILQFSESRTFSPALIILFSIGFCVTIGVCWEIVEFSVTTFSSYAMQHGNTDTMMDLLMDLSGGAVAACMGYLFVTNRHQNRILKRIVRKAMTKSK